ncbi:histidine kinase [Natrarchaeobius sp. A-rgal3]|uniref:histidine kinase n=1 Tax=Natrarchaeobius versutus TaxID=1679078 RepID=UPI00350F79F1
MISRSLVDEVGDVDYTIAVVGDDVPGALAALLGDAFADAGITVDTTGDDSSADGDELDPAVATVVESGGTAAVLLEEGTPVAASPMETLYESILAINSDLFTTGSRGLGEIELPNVLCGLADSRLRMRGYPLAHKEKLLLILVSRYIEQLAWMGNAGTLRSAFQQLSRIDDEIGTQRIYGDLAETDVDVHVYGVDDGEHPSFESTVHAGTGPAYRDSWFVVYRPPDRTTTDGAALVSVETEPRVWDGFFTFDPDHVARIDDAIRRAFDADTDRLGESGDR